MVHYLSGEESDSSPSLSTSILGIGRLDRTSVAERPDRSRVHYRPIAARVRSRALTWATDRRIAGESLERGDTGGRSSRKRIDTDHRLPDRVPAYRTLPETRSSLGPGETRHRSRRRWVGARSGCGDHPVRPARSAPRRTGIRLAFGEGSRSARYATRGTNPRSSRSSSRSPSFPRAFAFSSSVCVVDRACAYERAESPKTTERRRRP